MPNAEGRMEVTERDIDYVMAVVEMRYGVEEYPNRWYDTREQQREQLRRSAQYGNWPIRDYRAVAEAALAAARAENERLRADLDAVRKVVQLQADRDWIIVPWLNDAGDYVWRVNVRDVPSKKKGADTYTGTEHVGATPLDAGLRALAAQEGMR